ncbi:MAG TPA: YicC/YloC family endoribonuclease, partial [Bryobacteraceae bacterium]|nr:YicC/YloC family endoribonuclease [Bryobacteraceae bacterium]
MTGFARVRKADGEREVVMTVKSVNHRGLDVHFRMPDELDPFEGAVRAVIKKHVIRGHIQVQVKYVDAAESGPAEVNLELLEQYLSTFHRLSAAHGLHGQPDLNLAFQMPGMFVRAEAEPDTELEALLVAAAEEALVKLNEFREREGGEITADMRARNATVLEAARRMTELRANAVAEFEARLEERLAELLKSVELEPQRLAQEVAYLVD